MGPFGGLRAGLLFAMNYLSTEICLRRLGESTVTRLYDLPAGESTLADDIASAEAEVDAYVGKRYATPVTGATALNTIRPLAGALFDEIAWGRSSGDSIPQKAKDAAERARAMLRDISSGKAMLAGGSEIPAPATAGQAVDIVAEANPPAFKREHMAGF